MAARQIKATRKATPTGRNTPARTAVGKPKAVAAAGKRPAGRAAAKPKAAASAPKPASMTGPLPPIVTLKHLAEWAGYNHGVPKKQATDMRRPPKRVADLLCGSPGPVVDASPHGF